jgi:DNA-binding GntR family transcriptional regulator
MVNGDVLDHASKPSRPAAQRAYAHVKERLLDGRFAGGTLLSENDIAARLGVSRTPVRHAFARLQAEGLLELYPKRGALVVPVTPSEADDVFEARLLLEPHCAARAAEAPAGELLAELAAAIADQEGALASGRGFPQGDRRFHQALVAASGNALLERQYEMLRDRHQRIAASAVAADPGRVERFIAEHREIMAAIECRDPGAASELMREHLRTAHELARRRR